MKVQNEENGIHSVAEREGKGENMKSEFDKIEERRKASPACLLPDSETVYKGLFWFVRGEIVTVKIPCDNEGTVPSDYPFLPSALSKSGDNYTHKDAWMHLDESITEGHSFYYYPRGRVEIKKGKATVYCNPSLADEEHMDAVKREFRLDIQHGIEKVTVKADGSRHYKSEV